jgi:hypothetical protein
VAVVVVAEATANVQVEGKNIAHDGVVVYTIAYCTMHITCLHTKLKQHVRNGVIGFQPQLDDVSGRYSLHKYVQIAGDAACCRRTHRHSYSRPSTYNITRLHGQLIASHALLMTAKANTHAIRGISPRLTISAVTNDGIG